MNEELLTADSRDSILSSAEGKLSSSSVTPELVMKGLIGNPEERVEHNCPLCFFIVACRDSTKITTLENSADDDEYSKVSKTQARQLSDGESSQVEINGTKIRITRKGNTVETVNLSQASVRSRELVREHFKKNAENTNTNPTANARSVNSKSDSGDRLDRTSLPKILQSKPEESSMHFVDQLPRALEPRSGGQEQKRHDPTQFADTSFRYRTPDYVPEVHIRLENTDEVTISIPPEIIVSQSVSEYSAPELIPVRTNIKFSQELDTTFIMPSSKQNSSPEIDFSISDIPVEGSGKDRSQTITDVEFGQVDNLLVVDNIEVQNEVEEMMLDFDAFHSIEEPSDTVEKYLGNISSHKEIPKDETPIHPQERIKIMLETHRQARQDLFTFLSYLQESISNGELVLKDEFNKVAGLNQDAGKQEVNVVLPDISIQILRQFMIAAGATEEGMAGEISFVLDHVSSYHREYFMMTVDDRSEVVELLQLPTGEIQLHASVSAIQEVYKKLVIFLNSPTTISNKESTRDMPIQILQQQIDVLFISLLLLYSSDYQGAEEELLPVQPSSVGQSGHSVAVGLLYLAWVTLLVSISYNSTEYEINLDAPISTTSNQYLVFDSHW